VPGIRRQLATAWRTVWESIRPLLQAADADTSRFVSVVILGVDEHVWHHVSTKPVEDGGRDPKELTGMVDLTRDAQGHTRARLLYLVPGRSGAAYKDWLTDRGKAFRTRVQVATLEPFHGYKNAIDDQLEDARSVLDAFHVVKLATKVTDDVRRRVQQELHGHRGRKNDPLYRIRNILRAGEENLTERQRTRLQARGPPTNDTSRSKSPGCAPNRSAPPTTSPAMPPDERSRRRSSTPSPPARSPRSPASARPSPSGAASSSGTSTPTARATAAPKP